jgi:hypothetical protein
LPSEAMFAGRHQISLHLVDVSQPKIKLMRF